ncbi:2-dehydro-3-deoxygalactonokinase [Marinomonas epiphytica]
MVMASQTPNNLQHGLICVDWGSSNFRAFLLDCQGKVLESKESTLGVLSIQPDHFEFVLTQELADWLDLPRPILMSGMIGSRDGWQEVPYLNCPIELSQLYGHLCWLDTQLSQPVAIVPGIQCKGVGGFHDVMRGEETQLLGVLSYLSDQGSLPSELLCCLPGTHCKWARLSNGQINTFSTTTTGEIFSLLDNESSLVKGLPKSTELNQLAFVKGLQASSDAGGFLHQLFSARSRLLCGDLMEHESRDYLSGLVIAEDIRSMLSLLDQPDGPIVLVANDTLVERYRLAFEHFAVEHCVVSSEQASTLGLAKVAEQYVSKCER